MKTTDYPNLQKFNIEGVKHISPENAMAALTSNEAIIIDVREVDEVNLEFIFERYLRVKDGKHLCIPCSGQETDERVFYLPNFKK